jgi:hypothetical protein
MGTFQTLRVYQTFRAQVEDDIYPDEEGMQQFQHVIDEWKATLPEPSAPAPGQDTHPQPIVYSSLQA